ncbi:MAG: UDP-2,3-diacylglucosamine diphosphatase [Lewinellaceae bacterium]|nr:UDP-2,3-diacylglucosamine diphosphatase [Lewinellaceae bacterium]
MKDYLCSMQRKTFFASDFHLGVDARCRSRDREKQLVRWLQQCAPEAEAIYLVGDLFEFWFEYRHVVPKGFTRVLGTLAELRDGGLPIYAFTGNHDLWMFGYFEAELGIPVYRTPIEREIGGKKFFIGHGDGLGPNDMGYKRMKKVFTHPFSQWLYRWLHPDLGIPLANYSSNKSRMATPLEERGWLGDDKEWLLQYAERKLARGTEADYFIFGHRHLPIDWLLSNQSSRYINLGEWMYANSYAVFDGTDVTINFFEHSGSVIRNY